MIHLFTSHRFGLLLAVFSFSFLITDNYINNNTPVTDETEALEPINSSEYPENEPDTNITFVKDGFKAELLYDVPNEQQGSWVSLAVDPEGYLIASDQQNNGTYRIKVIERDGENPSVEVERLVMPISGAFGMLWAFDHLYANQNGTGLFRLRDENRDGQLNLMEYLGGPFYRGEHGNHTVIKTADGEGLYYVAGNHVPPPTKLSRSRVVSWEEDLLLPREWDARGHARGILAPGGYIARINPDATEWEMISIGYRNQYDAAINEHGELFTYDSDMEWDMGMPWYRPTRLLHVVSGSDYGWRSGSGKWPEYFEDSLPPMLNIGPGSPTGLEFGTGAKFPEKYQRALFAFDWTFGTIYAVHLTPDGPTYKAEAEEFITGSPLPVTSGVIGKDGAMYFITGGRNQESQLYRVIYTGDESTEPAKVIDNPEARELRELRRQLEQYHGVEDSEALDVAWPYLSSENRIMRHAARVAVESQPFGNWAERALSEEDPQARITAMVALARTASEEYRPNAIQALLELNLAELNTNQKLGYLRAMALVFMRLGEPDESERSMIANTVYNILPDNDHRVNTELIRVMVYLRDSRVIEPALSLIRNEQPPQLPDWSGALLERNLEYGGVIKEMIESPPPTTELGYAFMLRTLRNGWTIEQRKEYFSFINAASGRFGGVSYSGFLEDMRAEALRNSTDEEREAVADITGVSLAQKPDFEINPAEGPGRDWTLDGAMRAVSGQLTSGSNRNYERGRNAFFVTSCSACHRFQNYGGDIGPDLSFVNRRFSTRGLIEKIIDPNILISDQYSSSVVTLRSGETITGIVGERGEYLEIYTRNPTAEPTVVSADDVRSVEHTSVSQMPPGLINALNEEELRDLIAYIMSGGNPDHEMFMSEDELEAAREAAEREKNENENEQENSEN